MTTPHFFVTPMASTVCCTCTSWEGARILQDGFCHTLTEAVGYCWSTPDKAKEQFWKLPLKMASEAACAAWNAPLVGEEKHPPADAKEFLSPCSPQ